MWQVSLRHIDGAFSLNCSIVDHAAAPAIASRLGGLQYCLGGLPHGTLHMGECACDSLPALRNAVARGGLA